jgi:hypothetical protein
MVRWTGNGSTATRATKGKSKETSSRCLQTSTNVLALQKYLRIFTFVLLQKCKYWRHNLERARRQAQCTLYKSTCATCTKVLVLVVQKYKYWRCRKTYTYRPTSFPTWIRSFWKLPQAASVMSFRFTTSWQVRVCVCVCVCASVWTSNLETIFFRWLDCFEVLLV